MQQASLFTGGKILSNLGAFAQVTYDGIEHKTIVDEVDIRYADSLKLLEKELIYGVAVNNVPTAQDVWNSTPAWSYPFAVSSVARKPAAATMLEGGLTQQVVGISAYTLWDNWFYSEIGLYGRGDKNIARPFTRGTEMTNVLQGIAPYWRLTAQYESGSHYLAAGTFGMVANTYVDNVNGGPTNKFRDFGLDAQYQFTSGLHIASAQLTWINEKQTWDATSSAENNTDTLKTLKAKVGYHYNRYVGGTVSLFSSMGSSDNGLYASAPVVGSNNGKPNSRGTIIELNFLPWQMTKFPFPMTKLGLQYTAYSKFNGAGDNYDGFGRKASDNNTLYLYTWLMF